MSRGRPKKVADLIQRELSDLLRRDVRDPHVGMVTLTSVDVAPDLSHAKVFFTILDKDRQKDTTKALQQIQRDPSLACAEVEYLVDFIRSSQRGVILRRGTRRAEVLADE